MPIGSNDLRVNKILFILSSGILILEERSCILILKYPSNSKCWIKI